MEATMQPVSMAETIGKIIAGAYLYDFQERKIENLQRLISKAKKLLGKELFEKILTASSDQIKAFLHSCIDKAVLNELTTETKNLINNLDPTSRILVEMLFIRFTGQDITGHRPEKRWADELWKLRNYAERYLELSPSNVSAEELASVLKEVSVPTVTSIVEFVKKNL